MLAVDVGIMEVDGSPVPSERSTKDQLVRVETH